MPPRSLINLRNICRMCGERYDTDSKSVDIYESGPDNGPSYAELMKVHLDLQPRENDGKPKRIGETCAKLLDEWTDFKKKILETQKELLKLQQRRRVQTLINTMKKPEPSEEQPVDVQENEPSTSRGSARLASKRKLSVSEVGESSGSSSKQPKLKTKKQQNGKNQKKS